MIFDVKNLFVDLLFLLLELLPGDSIKEGVEYLSNGWFFGILTFVLFMSVSRTRVGPNQSMF